MSREEARGQVPDLGLDPHFFPALAAVQIFTIKPTVLRANQKGDDFLLSFAQVVACLIPNPVNVDGGGKGELDYFPLPTILL